VDERRRVSVVAGVAVGEAAATVVVGAAAVGVVAAELVTPRLNLVKNTTVAVMMAMTPSPWRQLRSWQHTPRR